jgi:hypothetical protein
VFPATSYVPDRSHVAHVSALHQAADLMAPFIENIVLLHRERRRRLSALAGLATIFGARLNPAAYFDELAEAIRPHLDFDVGRVAPGRDRPRACARVLLVLCV